MIAVIKSGVVVATHADNQDIAAKYPGATLRWMPDESPTVSGDGDPYAGMDTAQQDANNAELARVMSSRIVSLDLIDGLRPDVLQVTRLPAQAQSHLAESDALRGG